MFRNFMQRFQQWMIGRNGNDALNLFLIFVYIGLSFIGSVTRLYLLNSLALISFVFFIFRMFSKNISQRYKENVKFLSWWNKVKSKCVLFIRRGKEYKTFRYFTCKSCGQMIRVPRGKGKICITCPKCKNEFIKKT